MRKLNEFDGFGLMSGQWDGLVRDRPMWRAAGRMAERGDGGAAPDGAAARPIPSSIMSDFPAVIDLATLDGINGFRIDGIDASDRSGRSVSSAGDVNGDGFDDIVIGAFGGDPGGDSAAGESYVVFGHGGGFAPTIDLATLNGANGFRIDGIDAYDYSGRSVSSAGDVNGDGFDDIVIGAFGADPGGDSYAGESYVVFGHGGGFAPTIDLATLNGANGFRIDGIDAYDRSGFSVSSAGDVNGDGFDDIVIGAYRGDPGGDSAAGESYVAFGKAGGFGATLDLATLNGANGFRIDGIDAFDLSGFSVSSAGDVNGDGFDDIIIGAFGGDPGGDSYAGESYVVFGKAGGFAASLALAALDGSNGFRIDGIDANDESGRSVSSAGDVNGDGFDDIVIGAYRGDPGGDSDAGESYVVFGHGGGFAPTLDLATLNGANGFRIDGIDANDFSGFSVSSAGDVNGDGFDDIVIGASGGDPAGNSTAGESYVAFGKAGGFGATFDLATLDGANGFRIDGIDAGDTSGYSVSSAGDVNGDGFDDLVIGANAADPGGDSAAGESYVIFGRAPTEAVNRTGSIAAQAIYGGAFNDILSGLGGNDTLVGAKGSDALNGGTGADLLAGGGGNDTLAGGTGGDALNGGSGLDAASYLASTKAVVADLKVPSQNTNEAAGDSYLDVEQLLGSAFNDTLLGDNKANGLFGLAGNDSLDGRFGADSLDGGKGNDFLNGADDNDTLRGAGGQDTLRGGKGNDRFVLDSANTADRDTILDFSGPADEIALSGAAFGLAPGALNPNAFVIGAFAADASDRIIYKPGDGKLFFDPDGTGAQAQVLIATLTNTPTLSAGDFIVI